MVSDNDDFMIAFIPINLWSCVVAVDLCRGTVDRVIRDFDAGLHIRNHAGKVDQAKVDALEFGGVRPPQSGLWGLPQDLPS